MTTAEAVHIGRAGGPAAVPGFVVVKIATTGAPGAVRESAGAVPSGEEVGERGRRAILAPAVIEEMAGDGVGDEPAPGAIRGELARESWGDRTVAGKFSGAVGEAEQGGGRW